MKLERQELKNTSGWKRDRWVVNYLSYKTEKTDR